MAAAKTKPQESQLSKLSAKFDVEVHRTNPKGYTYIPIESHVARWNEVQGEKWDLRVTETQFSLLPGMTFGNRNPKPAAYALVAVEIKTELDGRMVTRAGLGGDFGAADDVDKLVKTALAEAIKKAGNEFGIGLYLWDEEERALITSAQSQGLTGQVERAASPAAASVPSSELDGLKNEVADLAVSQGVMRTGPAIAAHFGIDIGQLQDAEVLRNILRDNAGAGEASAAVAGVVSI